ncbi:MAG: type VII secretion protein EccB [Cryobacterium sp.]|nr:type VII secretion protein EccB [Cryobacterium sp.]
MATKKDLIEAQGFSRRRLLTAFTSGAPGGKELEPAKPLRAVAAGLALAAMVLLGGVFYGIMRPGLPAGWENNTLVLLSDTGARYLAIDGTLYPVINTASARLGVPAGELRVITTDRATIEGVPFGPTIGILGAPDDIAEPAQLINTGWSACVVDHDSTSLTIARTTATPASGAIIARHDDQLHVVAAGHRYAVDEHGADAVLRSLGLNLASAIDTDDRWLNLFIEGAPLQPIVVANAGTPLTSTSLRIGSVIRPQGSADDVRYLITGNGQLAPLTALAYQLYLLGTGAELGAEQIVSPADIVSLPTAAEPAGGSDWPETLQPLVATGPPCAHLSHAADGTAQTRLIAPETATTPPVAAGARVADGGGALVLLGSGAVALIDESATAYVIPGANADLLARLGYATSDVSNVPQAWMQFLPYGPELTVAGALSTPQLPGAQP